MILRDYQGKAADGSFREWQSVVSTLLVMPTGCGKTVVFSEIVRRMLPKRSLILAHREELIFQAREKIERIAGISCEIEMADMSASTSLFFRTPAVVATVQTLCKRYERFDPGDFGLVIVDEAHHSTASSYVKVLDHFKQNPDLRILGVTATPDRADEEALGQIYDTVAFDYEILDAIHDGWLVPVDQQMVHIADLDFSHIRTTAGDLNGGELASVMEDEKNLQGVVGSSIDIIGNRQSILFCASVRHAERACEIFNRHRSGMAGFVCGSTDKETRRRLFADFLSGQLQVLSNVGVATEGVDLPAASVIIMARPTKSRSLYAQCAGRALRPLPGLVDQLDNATERRAAISVSAKPSALLVDFVGNSGKHKLMTSADILGGKVSDEAVERAIKKAKSATGPVRMVELLDDAEDEIRKEKEARQKAESARRARLVAKVSYSTRFINPFDVLDITPVRERGWDSGKVLTEKQKAVLMKQGINPEGMPYAQQRQVLNEIFRRWNGNLCSVGQAKVLKRYGYPVDITRSEASKLIDGLAKNGWRKPA